MSGEPTLRKGDESADGWVEYLQTKLSNLGYFVEVDGTFGKDTLAAVKRFQTDMELQDRTGVVGNETWSALRGDEELEDPGSDIYGGGHVETGTSLRLENMAYYDGQQDTLSLAAYSVGTDEPADASIELFVHLKDPNGNEFDVTAYHGAQGERYHSFMVNEATKGHPDGDYSGLAQLPSNMGGEIFAFAFNKIGLIDL